MLAADFLAPGHIQGAAGQPDMTGGRLAQRRRDKRRRGHGSLGQHGAVCEKRPDALAKAAVENGYYQPQLRVQLLRPQGRVKVTEVILVQNGQRPCGWHVGIEKSPVIELRPLEHPDTGQPGDLLAVA